MDNLQRRKELISVEHFVNAELYVKEGDTIYTDWENMWEKGTKMVVIDLQGDGFRRR